MKSESQSQKAKLISEALNTKYFHHGYPVSRSEAKEIGLPIAPSNPEVEALMWSVWLDIEEEMKFREPFSPVRVLKDNTACKALFAPVIPGAPVVGVPAAPFSQIAAIMESRRKATRAVVEGEVLAMRQPDLSLKVSLVPHKEGWVDFPLPAVHVPEDLHTKQQE